MKQLEEHDSKLQEPMLELILETFITMAGSYLQFATMTTLEKDSIKIKDKKQWRKQRKLPKV
jgi:hypothetical protein